MYNLSELPNAIMPEPKNKPVPGREGAKEAEFSRSVNPIPTEAGGGRLYPHNTTPPYGPVRTVHPSIKCID